MIDFTSINDVKDLEGTIKEAIMLKSNPKKFNDLGKGKRVVLIFLNPSLRTRLSSEVAASNLGMDVTVLNGTDGWKLEFEDGLIMNMDTSEHVKEAAKVVSLYADIIGIRAFPGLANKELDKADHIINSFRKYSTVPVISLEGSIGHPLQALADAITITEQQTIAKPKVVLSWAPHPKALPHSVANSFVKTMSLLNVDLSITHPEGLELDPEVTDGIPILYDQVAAVKDADFVYVKNWSTYEPYGQVVTGLDDWMMTEDKLGSAYFMHCLPVRRNVVVEDAVLDGSQSLVLTQAENRIYAAQEVLKQILESL